MKATVSADSLHRMVYNARLLGPGTYLHVRAQFPVLTVSSWDGIEVIEDWEFMEDSTSDDNYQFSMTPVRAKQLELDLREITEDVVMEYRHDYLKVGEKAYITQAEYPDLGMLFDDQYITDLPAARPWALSPKRQRKFPLFKPGDYPVDFKLGMHTIAEGFVLYYKVGPSLRGAQITLDRADLKTRVGASCFF